MRGCRSACASQQGERDHPRRAEPLRRRRAPDADGAVGGPVARIRAVRRLRQGNAAHLGPARARDALRADERGDDHGDLPGLCTLLQGPAAEPLPHPVEVPRRGPATLRRHALARIPDEGRLFLRSRPGRRAPFLQQDVRRLSAHLRPDGPEVDSDARRYRPDRRRLSATNSSSSPRRARARFSATPTISASTSRRPTPTSTTSRACRASSTAGRRSMPRRPRCTMLPAFEAIAEREADVGPRHRGRAHLLFRHEVFGPDGRQGDGAGRAGARSPYGLLRHRAEPAHRRDHRGEPRRERVSSGRTRSRRSTRCC